MVINDVVTLLKETLPRAVALEMALADDLWFVSANSTQLSQVLMNLGVNGRDACREGAGFASVPATSQ